MSALIFNMTKKGYEAGRKIYIVSSADRMNVAAANTLLKFLEEPEGDVTAILLTDSYQSILPTIQSRCQRISFLPPSREMMIEKLVEKGNYNFDGGNCHDGNCRYRRSISTRKMMINLHTCEKQC